MSLVVDHIFKAENISAETIATISSIDLQYFPTPWKESDWNQLFTNSSQMLTVMRNASEVVGFTLFDVNDVDSFAHLLKIVIVPKCKNQGLGESLLKSSLGTLQVERKIRNLFLEVEVLNIFAIKLYKKFGFKIIHTKKDFYGTGRDAYIMTAEVLS